MNLSRPTNSGVWKAWLPAVVWLGLIAFESTSALSAENTGRFLYPLLHFLLGLDPLRFLSWHSFLRKSGHVIGYGLLSIFLFRAWRSSLPRRGNPQWSMAWARTAFFMTALVASLDEWHQTFLPSRTGTIHDVFLDSAAALGAQILLFIWLRGWRNGEPSEPSEPSSPFAARASESSS